MAEEVLSEPADGGGDAVRDAAAAAGGTGSARDGGGSGEDSARALASSRGTRDLDSLAGQLKEAVKAGDVESVRRLLRAGADMNHSYGDGVTPLHLAVYKDQLGVVKVLVRAGADIHAALDENALTPLDIARTKGNEALVEALLEGEPEPCHGRLVGPACITFVLALHHWSSTELVKPGIWLGWREAEAAFVLGDSHAYKATTFVAMVVCFLSLVLVNRLDPGAVNRTEVAYVHDLRSHTPEDELLVMDEERFAVVHVTHFDLFRWCRSCEMWKPRNVSHCSHCRRCFWRFDHHCPAVGNCIAARNHRFFVLLLVSGMVMWTSGYAAVFTHLLAHGAFEPQLEALWPPLVRWDFLEHQWWLLAGYLYLLIGLHSVVLVVWSCVHVTALLFNCNTKMCLAPQADAGKHLLNSRDDLSLLFCTPPRLKRQGHDPEAAFALLADEEGGADGSDNHGWL